MPVQLVTGIAISTVATGILAGAAVGYSFAGQNPNGPLGGVSAWNWNTSTGNRNMISPRPTVELPVSPGESGAKLVQELDASPTIG